MARGKVSQRKGENVRIWCDLEDFVVVVGEAEGDPGVGLYEMTRHFSDCSALYRVTKKKGTKKFVEIDDAGVVVGGESWNFFFHLQIWRNLRSTPR